MYNQRLITLCVFLK